MVHDPRVSLSRKQSGLPEAPGPFYELVDGELVPPLWRVMAYEAAEERLEVTCHEHGSCPLNFLVAAKNAVEVDTLIGIRFDGGLANRWILRSAGERVYPWAASNR